MTSISRSPSGSPDAVLVVREARKSYGDRQALRGVSMAVHSGEIVALLGPNGAGKTTLVRSICGRLALDSGSVRVGGEDPRRSVEARRRLGLVPQEIALYAELTVRENLEILGRLAGVERRAVASAVEKALGWTGLADRAADRVEQLSGGMRRRLNLAAGTLHGPDLLLLDEPTVGVDPGAREAIHDLLGKLRGQGLAVLLTTHDMDQASQLADRIAILNEGTMCADGSLDELLEASFGNEREIWVMLGARASGEGRVLLESAGLGVAPDDDRSWSGPLVGGLEALAELGSRLAEAGLVAEEFRVREPGLRGVFFRLTGRELDT